MSALESRSTPKPHLADVRPDVVDEQFSKRVRSLRLPQQPSGGSAGRGVLRDPLPLVCRQHSSAGLLAATYNRLTRRPTRHRPRQSRRAVHCRLPPRRWPLRASFALESKGYIIPAHQILVSPKVNGMVVKLRITESQRVHKGDDPGRVGGHGVSHRPRSGEGQSGPGQGPPVALRVGFTRVPKDLFPKHAISHAEYDMALGQRDEAAATVKLVEADLAKAQWRLDNCKIRRRSTARS